MRKHPDMIDKKRIRRHVVIDEFIDKEWQKDADANAAGNFSFVLRKILREHYGITNSSEK